MAPSAWGWSAALASAWLLPWAVRHPAALVVWLVGLAALLRWASRAVDFTERSLLLGAVLVGALGCSVVGVWGDAMWSWHLVGPLVGHAALTAACVPLIVRWMLRPAAAR